MKRRDFLKISTAGAAAQSKNTIAGFSVRIVVSCTSSALMKK